MNPTGKILSLQICPGHRKQMQVVEQADVIENLGLKSDTHALPDSSRQILLVEKETLDALGLAPGQVKENITTIGISLMTLPKNQHLQLGNEVILQITKACSPCNRMEEIRPGLLKEIAGKRGMLARVIRGGSVRLGDSIKPIKQ
jgi:MOSC domain-containing protein YiiM